MTDLTNLERNDRTTIDAVLIMEALARLLRAAPTERSEDDRHLQPGYIDNAIEAVIDGASIDRAQMATARQRASSEWDAAILTIVLAPEQVEPTYHRIQRQQSARR